MATPVKTVTCVGGTAKLGFASRAAFLFLLLATPLSFGLTNRLFGGADNHLAYIPAPGQDGAPADAAPHSFKLMLRARPKTLGLILHAVVYVVIAWLMMQPWKKEQCSEVTSC